MKTGSHDSRAALLSAHHLVQEFPVRARTGMTDGTLRALQDVSFEIRSGETLGVVGESGSGKTTLARALLQIPRPKSGSVLFRGQDLTRLKGTHLLQQRRHLQMVFQDAFSSLDPKWRVADIVEEPLIGYKIGTRGHRQKKVAAALEQVGLPFAAYGCRRPRELSGGECQRVAIARTLTLDPELIICDEAVSALDVLIQSQLLNLFEELRSRLGLSYVFISHDLAVVRNISDRVAVLHLGQLCEIGPTPSLYRQPSHPYTAQLLTVAAHVGRAVAHSPSPGSCGKLSSPVEPLGGCPFRFRCPQVQDRCSLERPTLRRVAEDHWVACHFPQHTSSEVMDESALHEHHWQTLTPAYRPAAPA